MAVLGINMTDKDPVHGWEAILPHARPENRLWALCISAWKLASIFVDEHRPWSEVRRMQNIAIELETLARNDDDCTCTPDHDCRVCNVVASLINDEDYIKTEKPA